MGPQNILKLTYISKNMYFINCKQLLYLKPLSGTNLSFNNEIFETKIVLFLKSSLCQLMFVRMKCRFNKTSHNNFIHIFISAYR
jgi:hypothetical protein